MADDSANRDRVPGEPRPPRRRLGGIRTRVVIGYVVLVTAALAVAVLVTWQVLLTRLDHAIDSALAQEVEELRLLADGTDPDTGEPFGTDVEALFDTFLNRSVPADDEAYYTFVDGAGHKTSFDAPLDVFDAPDLIERWATTTAPARIDVSTGAGEVRSLAIPLLAGDEVRGVFVVAFFPDGERSEILSAVRVVAAAGAVVLVVSAVLAWSLAGRVLRPVRRLTLTARTINDTDLSSRIPVDGNDELAELGRTFNDMIERLDAGFRTQRQFLDDVAHELRTPITIAQGHLDLLGDDLDAPGHADDVADTVEIVRDELDRMSRYVADLLVLAKAEHPDFLRVEPVDLGELAQTVMARVEGLGVRQWVCDAAPPPGRIAVIADPRRLEQALLNLSGNAVAHTGPDAEIGIGIDVVRPDARHADRDDDRDAARPDATSGGEGSIRLWVRDTGDGIDPEIADTLFRRHISGAARHGDGTGIGLSIVAVIARAHGGTVSAHSEPGAGATFTISIPLDTGPTTSEIARLPPPDPPAPGLTPPAAPPVPLAEEFRP